MFAVGCSVQLSSLTIQNNQAKSSYGGAVFATNEGFTTSVSLSSVNMMNNQAANGGCFAIGSYGSNSNSVTLQLNGGWFNGNAAQDGSNHLGGGLAKSL